VVKKDGELRDCIPITSFILIKDSCSSEIPLIFSFHIQNPIEQFLILHINTAGTVWMFKNL